MIDSERFRRSGARRNFFLSGSLLCLPLLLLLALLLFSAERIPQNSLRLISEEGTTIYYNTATVQNADALFGAEEPGWKERLRVTDYLMRPFLSRLELNGTQVHAIVNRMASLLIEGVLQPGQIRDLSLLLREGPTGIDTTGDAPASTLQTTGFRGEIQSAIRDVLQQSIRSVVRSELQILREHGAYQTSIVVLERQRDHLELRAMVDTGGTHGLNGSLMIRQAGSVLKPFIYALAFDRFALRPGDAIDDTPLRIHDGSELYQPRNHDNLFAGRITLREALAASRNIPAVRMLQLVGTTEYANFLKEAGLDHLQAAEQYGLSLALGTGGATTLQTAMLFSIPAQGGEQLPLLIGYDEAPIYLTPAGQPVRTQPPIRRHFSKQTALLITHVLADREARRISFGRRNFLDFPFDVAAKTGTSQSFRDSWTAGYTNRYVVAVWVGNFSGASMNAVSGLRGAARIFHQVMRLLAEQDRPSFRYPSGWKTRSVCRNPEDSDATCSRIEELSLPGEKMRSEDGQIKRILLDQPVGSRRLLKSPLQGQIFYLDPHRQEGQSIPFEFNENSSRRFTLYRDGSPLMEYRNRPVQEGRILIDLPRGQYEIRIADTSGARVMIRQFEVR